MRITILQFTRLSLEIQNRIRVGFIGGFGLMDTSASPSNTTVIIVSILRRKWNWWRDAFCVNGGSMNAG
jgi:hypothetical protein